MGTYIVLVNSTDKGAVNVREVPNRQQTSRDTAAKLGIVRKTVYMTLGPYDFVQIIEAPNDEAVAKSNADASAIRTVAAEVARRLPHVARVLTRDDLLRPEAAVDSVSRAMQFGFYGPRSADLEVVPEPYYIFGSGPGTSHSTPYGYDNHVPLIFYGTGVPADAHYEPATVNDVAPTLAAILGVETPSGAVGKVLVDVVQAH